MSYPNPSSMVPLIIGATDGPTLTGAAAASCIPVANRLILPNNYFQIGKQWYVMIAGRISCVVTTPGTARFDLRLGPSGTIVAFDSGALNLNIVAKVNVPFLFEALLTCRSVGNGVQSTLFGQGRFTSEAVVGSPLPSVGGNGSLLCPVGAPAVGTGFDNTAANAVDMFFTQTVATGSMTVHQYGIYEKI
jgi:hypothetical protein